MRHLLPVQSPFSFAQSLAFLHRFPPCQGDFVLEHDAVTAAVMVDGRAVAFTVREREGQVWVEVPDDAAPAPLIARAVAWLGADHDVTQLYFAAENDPPFRALARELYGLHHVAFLTLEEIAVYCVMMQRAPISMAAAMKRRFLDHYGRRVRVGERELRAMPTFDHLVALDGAAIGEVIRHAGKGPAIAKVVRGVAALGEPFLRTAPYATARDALLAIPGVGPFSAAAILLRGLGRMDELPSMEIAEVAAKTLYGASYDPDAIRRRYGQAIGYWSFYVKSGVRRLPAIRGSVAA